MRHKTHTHGLPLIRFFFSEEHQWNNVCLQNYQGTPPPPDFLLNPQKNCLAYSYQLWINFNNLQILFVLSRAGHASYFFDSSTSRRRDVLPIASLFFPRHFHSSLPFFTVSKVLSIEIAVISLYIVLHYLIF